MIALNCVIGFLIGGIPFGFILGRLVLKDDIRNFGSGNIGATNVGRVLGWKYGGLVLLLDAAKGFLPTWLAQNAFAASVDPSARVHAAVAAGICAIVGHMYPIWLRLRGGKGVATAVGVVAVLAPAELRIALAAFLITLGLFRIVALSSISAAMTFGVSYFVRTGSSAFDGESWSLTVFAVAVPLLIIWRHRSNIAGIVSGRHVTADRLSPHDSGTDVVPSVAEEMFDVVDEQDRVIDTRPRSYVHAQRLRHRAVHVFLFRTDGSMLIHLRHPDKEEFPNVWTSSASGHVSAGEDYSAAAVRELREELGVQADLNRSLRVAACPETSNEFTELFTACSDEPIRADPQEISDIRWVRPEDAETEVSSQPECFSPAFRVLFREFRRVT
ncbi:MAG: glycerol-3-phosphate 1-O-acyltransferase PlsY [Planctomycetaceae bacterium]|nr:glycerol-3-phosphate 1-O-acyltransferase PlsY [Planctomycetaceae bacterium]